jgi:hypothetical protein
MIRSAAGKVAWLARATTTLLGLAIMLALVFGVATTAMSATGGNFLLGKANGADRTSKLTASVAGPALTLVNQSTEAAATALNISVASGKAPIKVNAAAGTATYLSADELDGKDSADFYAAGSKVADSSHADQADSATNATNAQNAESATTADSATNADNAELLDNKDSSAFQPSFKSTVVVSPVGTDSENGTALLDALSGITDASATNPYLLYIEPGTYDLGTDSLQMKQYVDMEGSGELATTITSAISNIACNTGTVRGANDAEMRFLAVQNTGTGPDDCGFGIYNEDASPRLTSMSVTASGGVENVFGVYNVDSSPVMTDVSVTAAPASGNSIGVADDGNSSPTIRDSVIVAEDSGIYAADGSGTIRVDGSRIEGGAKTIFIDGEGFTTLVGASQLDGGPVVVISTSTTTCAGVYDESYNFFPSTCP